MKISPTVIREYCLTAELWHGYWLRTMLCRWGDGVGTVERVAGLMSQYAGIAHYCKDSHKLREEIRPPFFTLFENGKILAVSDVALLRDRMHFTHERDYVKIDDDALRSIAAFKKAIVIQSMKRFSFCSHENTAKELHLSADYVKHITAGIEKQTVYQRCEAHPGVDAIAGNSGFVRKGVTVKREDGYRYFNGKGIPRNREYGAVEYLSPTVFRERQSTAAKKTALKYKYRGTADLVDSARAGDGHSINELINRVSHLPSNDVQKKGA